MNITKHLGIALGAGLVAGLALFGAACGLAGGDDGGDENAQAAEAAVRAAIDAWNGGDLDGFLGAFTDEGVIALFGGFSREEVLEFFGEEDGAGDPQFAIQELSAEAEGDDVAVELTTIEGAFQYRQRVTMIEQDGAWLVNDFEHLTQDVPDAKVGLDVTMLEYSFEFDESAITGGNLALNLENAGGAPHELILERVPEDLDIEQALQSEQEPEGIEEIGFAGPFAPGADLTAILVDDLAPGRYVLLCFVPDDEGTPHALLGMWSEFAVE